MDQFFAKTPAVTSKPGTWGSVGWRDIAQPGAALTTESRSHWRSKEGYAIAVYSGLADDGRVRKTMMRVFVRIFAS